MEGIVKAFLFLGGVIPKGRPDHFDPDNCEDGTYHFQSASVDYGFPINEGGVVFIQLSALRMAQRVQLLFVENGQGAYYKVVWSSRTPSQVNWSIL